MQFKNITIFCTLKEAWKYEISPIILGVSSFEDIAENQNIVSSKQDFCSFFYNLSVYKEDGGINSLYKEIELLKDKVEIIYFTNCSTQICSVNFSEFISFINENRFIKLVYFHDTVINIDKNIGIKISESDINIKFAYFAAWDVAEPLKLITENFFRHILRNTEDFEPEERNLSSAVKFATDQKGTKQQGNFTTNIEEGNDYGNWEFTGTYSVYFHYFPKSDTIEDNNKKLKKFINVHTDTDGKREIGKNKGHYYCLTLVVIVPFKENKYPHRWLFHDKNVIEIVRTAREKMQRTTFIRGFCASAVNDNKSTLDIDNLDTTIFIIFPEEHYSKDEIKSIENIREQVTNRKGKDWNPMIPTETSFKNKSKELINDRPADDLVVELARCLDELFIKTTEGLSIFSEKKEGESSLNKKI